MGSHANRNGPRRATWGAAVARLLIAILLPILMMPIPPDLRAAKSLPVEGLSGPPKGGSGPPEDALWGIDSFDTEKPRYDARVAAYEAKHAELQARVRQAKTQFRQIESKLLSLESFVNSDLQNPQQKENWGVFLEWRRKAHAASTLYLGTPGANDPDAAREAAARRTLWARHLRWLRLRKSSNIP